MKRVRAFVAAFALATVAGLPLAAYAQDAAPAAAAAAPQQEITDEQLQAAVAAFHALGTDKDFDEVLPGVATQVETILIQQRPDLFADISRVVYEVANDLVARRADLTNDVARVWAQAFTVDELNAITAFYTSPAGQKLATMGQPVMQETVAALQAWSDRLSTELLDRSLQEFDQQNIDF